jgi:hypothetical protein
MSKLFSKPKVVLPPAPPIPELPAEANTPDTRQRTRRQQSARTGRSSTVLTSPTGLQSTSNIGATILGS